MERKKLFSLFDRYASRKATPTETEFADAFLERMQQTDAPSVDHRRIERNLRNQLGLSQKRHGRRSLRWKVASAAAVVAISFGYFMYEPVETIKASTAVAERKNITLPDGSRITLNGNSTLVYHSDFSENRELTLTGEAFFKVHRDTAHPFVVHTKQAGVTVLGTSFNVNASDPAHTKVNVATGKVEVKNRSGQKAYLLPDDQAILSDENLVQSKVSAGIATAWMDDVILLDKTSLSEMAKMLKIRFGTDIVIADDLEKETISGKFRHENPDTILKAIALVKDLEITRKTKNSYTIRRKPQQTQR